jgi:hypothetical protein
MFVVGTSQKWLGLQTHMGMVHPPSMKRVQTRTMTIYLEANIHRKQFRNGIRMHLPRANVYHVLFARGRCILQLLTANFRFILASVHMVVVRVFTIFN